MKRWKHYVFTCRLHLMTTTTGKVQYITSRVSACGLISMFCDAMNAQIHFIARWHCYWYFLTKGTIVCKRSWGHLITLVYWGKRMGASVMIWVQLLHQEVCFSGCYLNWTGYIWGRPGGKTPRRHLKPIKWDFCPITTTIGFSVKTFWN